MQSNLQSMWNSTLYQLGVFSKLGGIQREQKETKEAVKENTKSKFAPEEEKKEKQAEKEHDKSVEEFRNRRERLMNLNGGSSFVADPEYSQQDRGEGILPYVANKKQKLSLPTEYSGPVEAYAAEAANQKAFDSYTARTTKSAEQQREMQERIAILTGRANDEAYEELYGGIK